MPEICRLPGIVITMHAAEHDLPRFHVRHDEHRAVLSIVGLNLLAGRLAARVRGLVEEWAALHRAGRLATWNTERHGRIGPRVRWSPR